MQAKRDNNRIATILAVKASDGITPDTIYIKPGDGLLVDDDTTGSYADRSLASRDENRETTMLAVSSDDGETPIELYVNDNHELLISSS